MHENIICRDYLQKLQVKIYGGTKLFSKTFHKVFNKVENTSTTSSKMQIRTFILSIIQIESISRLLFQFTK